jgi:hypothetical protein
VSSFVTSCVCHDELLIKYYYYYYY